MDSKHNPSADTLPERLGLTEAEMSLARTVIDEALAECIPMGHVVNALEAILASLDSQSAIETVMQQLKDKRQLLQISIAYRAYALGLNAGRQGTSSHG